MFPDRFVNYLPDRLVAQLQVSTMLLDGLPDALYLARFQPTSSEHALGRRLDAPVRAQLCLSTSTGRKAWRPLRS